ncbi:MAG: hypothetical protein JSS69_03040 [Acidobacteria bacterium]|nr:hypothetical protein [Acidobacteriota bacterium]MBS1864868.1 hypothetical protein [Acidobacteriota bacterium]
MALDFSLNEPYFRIQIAGREETFPTVLDVSSFLYDLNLLYEIARLATDPNYDEFRFSRFVYFRSGRPLKEADRLRIQSLRQESPLALVAVLTAVPVAIGAVWGVVQIVEKIANAPLNRRKLKAEVEKLERENRETARSSQALIPDNDEQVRSVLRVREAEQLFDSVAGRLERSSVHIKELEIEIVQPRRIRKSE